MTLLFGIFNTVFFPTASLHENKHMLFKKINKFLPYLVLTGIPFIFFCQLVILKLYGSKYPFNPFWALLFGIACVLIFLDGAYSWTLASVGEKGVRIVSAAAIAFAVANIVSNVIFISAIGITGAIVSIIVAFLISIAINLFFGRKYLYAV
jgi:O-antigen/teichoic acid export membrane protein